MGEGGFEEEGVEVAGEVLGETRCAEAWPCHGVEDVDVKVRRMWLQFRVTL